MKLRRSIGLCALVSGVLVGGLVLGSMPLCAQVARRQTPIQQLFPNPPVSSGQIRIRLEEGRINAQLRAAPLPAVLEELAARTGVVFEVGTHENTLITGIYERIPVREAIQRIVGDNNSIFYYGRDDAGGSQVKFVRILSRSGPPQPSLRYIGSGSVTKSGEDTIDTPDQALRVLAESDSVEARQKAVEVLASAKGDAAVESLAKAAEDPAPEVRSAAIEALAGIGAQSTLAQILKCLKDKSAAVRQSAVMAVALLGDAENVKDLRPLATDKDAGVASAAEIAIGKLSVRRP